MKKKKIVFCVFTLILVCLIIILVIFSNRNLKLSNDISLSINNLSENLKNTIKEQKQDEYIDNNNMQIGLYIDDGGVKRLAKEYYCDFSAENVMGIFYAIPTVEETVSGDNFKQVFESYYNNYINKEDYKIGYNIKFTLDDGEYIDQTILNPDDAYLMFPEIQFYLYDDINLIPGRPYYHITQDIMTDERICSSVKLVGDKKTKNIVSPIELTVFTFDGEDDFSPITRKYRGNSSYTIFIYEE